jgi:hypothetical protein
MAKTKGVGLTHRIYPKIRILGAERMQLESVGLLSPINALTGSSAIFLRRVISIELDPRTPPERELLEIFRVNVFGSGETLPSVLFNPPPISGGQEGFPLRSEATNPLKVEFGRENLVNSGTKFRWF